MRGLNLEFFLKREIYLRENLILFFQQQSWVTEALFPALSSVPPEEEDKHFTSLSDWNTEAKIEK